MPMLQILIKMFIVSVYIMALGVFHVVAVENIRTYHNGKFTYIQLNSTNDSITIFDTHKTAHHPVLSRSYFRGKYSIERLQDNMYILAGALPGKGCRENPIVSHKRTDYDKIIVHFKLGNAKRKYQVWAKSNDNDLLYRSNPGLGERLMMELPVNADGYAFSIMPEENDNSITGIVQGFAHTIKYLNLCLPDGAGSLFSSPKEIEVSLPSFRDSIFDEWCIDGDIIQIYNYVYRDKIIWHGQEFLPCKNITEEYEM